MTDEKFELIQKQIELLNLKCDATADFVMKIAESVSKSIDETVLKSIAELEKLADSMSVKIF